MAYEIFKKTRQITTTPTLTIATNGTIALNATAGRVLSERNIKLVYLLWDKDRHRLAIKAAPKADRNSYRVSLGDSSSSIRAKTFLRHIGWNALTRESLEAFWNESEKMFEALLPAQYVGLQEGLNERKRKA